MIFPLGEPVGIYHRDSCERAWKLKRENLPRSVSSNGREKKGGTGVGEGGRGWVRGEREKAGQEGG